MVNLKVLFCILLQSKLIALAYDDYISCAEQPSRYHGFHGSKCTLSDITESYFETHNWYNDYRSQISVLQIEYSKFVDIPRNIFDKFSSIETLNLSHTGLEEMQKNSFYGGSKTSISTLDLSFCEFKTLYKQMFSLVPSIQWLHLNGGLVEEIKENAFFGLENLKSLFLNNNNIQTVNAQTFLGLENLIELDLSANQIKIITSGTFGESWNTWQQLTWLDLSHNQIRVLESGFITITNMGFLSLANNNISEFNSSLIEVKSLAINDNKIKNLHIWSTTTHLNASSNNISNLTCDSALQVTSLDLSNNQINLQDSFSECFSSATNLNYLDLSHSYTGKLNYSTFAALTELETLRLSHTSISNVVSGVFSHQEKLKILDLSYNNLKKFSIGVLLSSKSLEELFLEGNEITEIDYYNIRSILPQLRTLGINENSFNCTYLTEFIMFFNVFGNNLIVNSGKKITHASNIKGIGCIETPDEHISLPENSTNLELNLIIKSIQSMQNTMQTIQSSVADLSNQMKEQKSQISKLDQTDLDIKEKLLKLELRKVNNTDSAAMLWPLINQLNNITLERQQLSNTIQLQKINQTQHEIELLRSQIKDQKGSVPTFYPVPAPVADNSMQSDISSLKNIIFILTGVVITTIGYVAYQKYKKMTSIRRYNTQTTLNTNIELNGHSRS